MGDVLRNSTNKWRHFTVVPRLCVLNSRMKTDSGGLGDMQGTFQHCQSSSYFTSINLPSGFFQMPITEAVGHKTAFRDAFGQLWECNRGGLDLKIFPPAFASMAADLLSELQGKGVGNCLNGILIYTKDFDKHLALIKGVLSQEQSAGLSVNVAKSR